MGNHLVGQMFVAGIANYTQDEIDKMTSEEAMVKIEKIGEVVMNSTSLDAEYEWSVNLFDDYLDPSEKLGSMVVKAFYPTKYKEWKNKPYVDEEMDEEHYNKVYRPFIEKFGFR